MVHPANRDPCPRPAAPTSHSLLSTVYAYARKVLHLLNMEQSASTLPTLDCYSTNVQQPMLVAALSEKGALNPLSICYMITTQYNETRSYPPEELRIICFELSKQQKALSKHEAAIGWVTHGGRPWSEAAASFILCKRGMREDNNIILRQFSRSTNSSNKAILGTAIGSLYAAVGQMHPIEAYDTFTFHPPSAYKELLKVGGAVVIFRTDFPVLAADGSVSRAPPTLIQLCAAMVAIHTVSPRYNLQRHQCYWFVGMLYYMLSGVSSGSQPLVHASVKFSDVNYIKNLPHAPSSMTTSIEAGPLDLPTHPPITPTIPSAITAMTTTPATPAPAPGGRTTHLLGMLRSHTLSGKGWKDKLKERHIIQAGEISFSQSFKISTDVALEEVYIKENLHALWVKKCEELITNMTTGTTWTIIAHPDLEVLQLAAVGDAAVSQSAGLLVAGSAAVGSVAPVAQ
ncbi:hypothetical protein C8Q79DRAFT_1100990 [Trametes meyenii]|nr:hypothetical protein C8Q79DRAFT_1100990 [Trametes meyenii]